MEASDVMKKVGLQTAGQLNLVTQETRYQIILSIIAHPKQLPTLKELAWAHPKINNRSTIHEHLQKLIEAGVVDEFILSEENQGRDLPYKFYGLTKEGREFVEAHNLIPQEELLQNLYARINKPEEIERYEEAPRPDVPDTQAHEYDTSNIDGEEEISDLIDPDSPIYAMTKQERD